MDRAAKIIVVILVVAAGGYFIVSKIAGWHKHKVDTAIEQQQRVSQQKEEELEQKISELEQELSVAKGQNVPEEKLAEVFGSSKETVVPAAKDENQIEVVREVKKLAELVGDEKELVAVLGDEKKDIEKKAVVQKKISTTDSSPDTNDIERQILAFFNYLDAQPYIQSYQFEDGSYLQYQIALKNLSSKPPILTGEMDSLYNMVRNLAHFYRAMGKKRVSATRQVLQNESEIIEIVMKTFYQWFTMESDSQADLAGRPSHQVMYQYAGYILDTLGGRSYLLRRSPKVRALTGYYCVLALDKANDLQLNSKGIDIRPYIKSSLMEVKNQIGLMYQKEYIANLNELNLKYYSY